MTKISQRIKEVREKLKMSQGDLAALMGYQHRSSISKIELGSNDIPQSKISKFAQVLNTTTAYLMGWEDEGSKDNTQEISFNLKRNGNFLRERRLELGLELKDIADATNTDPLTVSEWEIGSGFRLSQEQLSALSKVLKVDEVVITSMPVYFLDDVAKELSQPKPEFVIVAPAKRVSILGSIAAGTPLYMDENIIGHIFADLPDSGNYFAVIVRGDSMNLAGIMEGSVALIKETPCVENGEIAAVSINGEEATLKEYRQDGDIVILNPISNNPDNKPQVYNIKETDVRVMGEFIEARTRPRKNPGSRYSG